MAKINSNLQTSEVSDFDEQFRGDRYLTVTCCMDEIYINSYNLTDYLRVGKVSPFDTFIPPWFVFCGINEQAEGLIKQVVNTINKGERRMQDLPHLLDKSC